MFFLYGEPLFVEFGINLVATQDTVEEDVFDKFYDKSATFPNVPTVGTKATKTADVPTDKTQGMTIKNNLATIEIPSGNISDDASKYRLDVERIENIAEGQEGAVTLTSDTNTLVSYDVSLVEIKSDDTETKVTSEQAQEYTVTLYVGTHCDLIKLYHKGTEINDFNYNPATGEVTYKTKSFSPYAAEIKYAGGEGTKEHPYILANEVQFLNLKDGYTSETKDIYFEFANDMDMSTASIQSLKGQTYNRDRWFELIFDKTLIHIDMNNKSINNLDCFLFAGIQNLDIENGTINFIDGGNEAGIIYYVESGNEGGNERSRNLTFKNLILNGTFEVNMLHYGPVIAQSYEGSFETDTVLLENIVSNVQINNTAGGAYTGGLLGYVSGPLTIKNCTFNGTIQSPLAGGFINPMSVGKAVNESNTFNGKLLATNTVQKFGHGDNTVAVEGEGSSATKVTIADNLLVVGNIGDEIKLNHTDESLTRYAVSIMVWTNQATCTTVFDVNVPASAIGEISTGLYKNYFENTRTDGSTAETKVSSGWYDGCIWRDGDTYKVYCTSDTEVNTTSNSKATIYVYGYNSEGILVTYQTQSYFLAKN